MADFTRPGPRFRDIPTPAPPLPAAYLREKVPASQVPAAGQVSAGELGRGEFSSSRVPAGQRMHIPAREKGVAGRVAAGQIHLPPRRGMPDAAASAGMSERVLRDLELRREKNRLVPRAPGLRESPREGDAAERFWQESVASSEQRVAQPAGPEMQDVPPPLTRVAPRSLRERVRMAVSVPVLVGGVVFLLAIFLTVVGTMLRSGGEAVSSLADSAGSSAAGTAEFEKEADGKAAGEKGEQSGGVEITGDSESQIVVYVSGEVAKPGVVHLPQGARVFDALEKAGGATAAAVLDGVNLARVLQDGEQIAVPNAEQAASNAAGGAGAAGAAGAAGGASGKVNINRADLSQLDTLPGVGPALAQRIIDWRSANGSFTSVEQLREVSGIGDKVFAKLQQHVSVG